MNEISHCPDCGAELAAGTPKALCPQCALKGLLEPAGDGSASVAASRESAAEVTPNSPLTPSLSPPEGERVPAGRVRENPGAGRRFGDYELLDEIARGGMGVVYKSRQKSLDRLVAVKLLLFGPHASAEFIKRFRIEASAAAALQHPNIVAIHEVGVHEGEHFLVMDYVDGPNLAKLVREQPLPPKRAAQYLKTIAEAIHYAHEHGILHRDLKPSNVLIDSSDQPRVTDFGLAKRLGTDSQPSTQDVSQLTLSGQVMGSPGYMPPEQASGARGTMSRRSDVYSLGAMLYHLLTGRPPFGGGSVAETLKQVEIQEPVSVQLLNPAVPLDLETICLKCLQKEPRSRYHTALELAEECGRFVNDEPIRARPVGRAEKLWRWCRRHPAVASLAAAVAVLLVTATTVSTVAALRVSSARNAERVQWHRAESNAVAEARQRQRTEQTLRDLEMWRAEDFFSSNDSLKALAWLARVLRRDPGDRTAAERLLAALTQRSFALPLFEYRLQEDGFLTAAISPNGRFVATLELTNPAVGGIVTVLDSRTREPVGAPRRAATGLFLQFSPDSDRWLCLSNTHVFIQKTLLPGPEVVVLEHTSKVHTAGFNSDGSRILVVTYEALHVWDAQTGRPAIEPLNYSLRRQGNPILELSGDNQRLLLATRLGVQLHNFGDGRSMTLTNARVFPVTVARFSFQGNRVLMTSSNEVAAWRAEDGSFEGYLLKFDKSVKVLDLSRDGMLALVRSEELLRVWSVDSGLPYGPSFRPVDGLTRAQFSPNGRRIATMSEATVQIWDSASGVAVTEPFQHEGEASVELSSDGARALAIIALPWVGRPAFPTNPTNHEGNLLYDGPRIARLWDVGCREAIHMPSALTQPKGAFLEIGPDGVTGFKASTNGHSYLLNVVSNGSPQVPLNLQRKVLQARFSPDSTRFLTLDEAGTVRVWAVETRQQLFILEDEQPIRAAEFSAGNQWILTFGSNHLLRVWDSASGKAVAALRHDYFPQFARASLDGERIITGSGWPQKVRSVRTWQTRSGKLLQELKQEVPFRSVELSPDGRFIVTTVAPLQGMAVDNTAKLWDAETGGLERAFLHSSWITTAAFSADSRKVVTACEDGGARVWSVESAALLTEVKQRAHTTSAELSPDGLRLVTSCADGTTRVWDSRTGLPIAEAFRHRNSFHKSRFSAIGERVIIEPNSTLFLISARWKPPPMDLVHARWVWELPAAPPFIPPWLPALAEAVAGQRLNPHGHLEPVPMSELQELHQELAASSHTDYYTRWAKWFFADREARSCSPFSSVMVPEYIRRNLEEGSDRSLREVLRLAPNHALAMARLARRVWAQKPEGNAHRKTEADLLSRRAVQLSSDDPEVVKIRRDIAQGIASLSKP